MLKSIIIFILVIKMSLSSVLSFAEVYISAEEAIKQIFPDLESYQAKDYDFEDQIFKVFTINKYGDVLGWAVVADEMGKKMPITFLVGIDKDGKVLGIYILEFREIQGSEIKRRSFLRQFIGKSSKDKIKTGSDIDAVTGATISSQSAASAVRKSLKLIEQIEKDAFK